jgi:AraC-like DNA-binding protein
MIPRERVLSRNVNLGNLVLRRFSGRRGLGKLIWGLVSTTFDQMDEIRSHSGHDVADVVARVIQLALLDNLGERTPFDSREALRERIKTYISNHLGDPDLSLTKLAQATGCTKRYLHMAFQPETTSISDYILKLRLERCREDLLNPAHAHRSITDIAYSWGFNNSNHFSRRFKQEFGICPRRSRAEFASWLVAGSGNNAKPA